MQRQPRPGDLAAVSVQAGVRPGRTGAAGLAPWFTMRAALPRRAKAVCTFRAFPL